MFKLLSVLSLLTAILAAGNLALAQSSTTTTKPEINKAGSPKTDSSTVNNDRPMSLPEKLKLTPDQKKKIAASGESMYQKIADELTPEQRKKFEANTKNKSQIFTALKSLKLTPDQVTKIRAVSKATNAEIESILTPEQVKELKIAQENRKANQAR
jgi:Spy/CpxP family protein refolding chaperone